MIFGFGNRYAKTRISTPYSKLSETELLSRFKSDSWSKLNQQEKIDTIQELENRFAVEQKRPVAEIKPEEDPSNYGSYVKSSNTIRIRMEDSDKNTSYEMLDSYYHESRHAQQYQAIKLNKGLNETTRNVCKTELNGNYVGGGKYYDMQTCEMDSNNYAADKMLSNKDLFDGDKQYDEYLERRREHFENVNKSCHEDVDYRARQQINNANRSLARGTITEKQAKQIKEQVYSDHDDPVLAESCNIENKLREENSERAAMNNTQYGIYTPTPIVHADENGNKTYDYGKNEPDTLNDNSAVLETEKHEQFFENEENNAESDDDVNLEDNRRQFFEGYESVDSEEVTHEKHEQFFEDSGDSDDGENSKGRSKSDTNSESSGESASSGQRDQSSQMNSIT